MFLRLAKDIELRIPMKNDNLSIGNSSKVSEISVEMLKWNSTFREITTAVGFRDETNGI